MVVTWDAQWLIGTFSFKTPASFKPCSPLRIRLELGPLNGMSYSRTVQSLLLTPIRGSAALWFDCATAIEGEVDVVSSTELLIEPASFPSIRQSGFRDRSFEPQPPRWYEMWMSAFWPPAAMRTSSLLAPKRRDVRELGSKSSSETTLGC